MPLANSGSYVNLESFGFFAESEYLLDNVVFENNTYGDGALLYSLVMLGQKCFSISDDGFVSLGSGSASQRHAVSDAAIPHCRSQRLDGDPVGRYGDRL